ncbi:MAG: hypothetical protein PHP70_03990 [Gallionella sp.]|nr:hypothetical protein [Gallionella sp.]
MMKKNTVIWCDSTGKQRRFTAIDTGDAAVDDVSQTAATLHKTGAAQWAIYFGDKGTPVKRWGISPEQAKVIAGMYKPLNQMYNSHVMHADQSCGSIKVSAMAKSKQVLQLVTPRKSG